jgi:hypothetical protein
MIEMGRTGTWDIFCQALMMGAIFHLYLSLKSANVSYRGFILTGIFIGLSAMSKGPVAIYGMLLPFLISYFIVFGFSSLNGKRKAVFTTIVIAAILSAWWYLYARLEAPQMSTAVVEKEIDAWVNRHRRPFWFYLHFPVFTGIWSVFVIAALFYGHFRKKITETPTYLFLLLWTLIAVLLLSLVPEKKERYLLPVMPPMALLAGMMLNYLREKLAQREERNKVEKTIYYIFGTSLLLLLLAAPAASYLLFYQAGYMTLIPWALSSAGFLLLFLAGLLFLRKMQLIKLTGIAIGGMMLITTFLLPGFLEFYYKNPGFQDISEISKEEWYGKYDFYTIETDLNLKAIWRIGKNVKKIETEWPEESFVMISSVKLPPKDLPDLHLTSLGTYDYYRKKSKFRLYVTKVEF